ncbi:hypothetical protein LWI29_016875 [Acer saccharum]|uniref:ADP,ATP carrier protein n=1 Tax=Acer saccharum TaxID=4024 RepID=A0AA39SJW9_ACESA|nr:hypothetical protein LWI29_016875 [Acer saccharum]
MMLLSQYIFDKYGWGVAAKITPTVLLVKNAAASNNLSKPEAQNLTRLPNQNTRNQNGPQNLIISQESEVVIEDEDAKVKGKAAIDVVCNPLGKSGGALIQQFMIKSFGSLANSTPHLGGILMVIVLAWLGAAKSLDTQFTSLRKEEELEKEMERAAAVKISVVSQNEDGNGSLPSGSSLNPATGDSTSSSSETSPAIFENNSSITHLLKMNESTVT